jgi:hypothetical protein
MDTALCKYISKALGQADSVMESGARNFVPLQKHFELLSGVHPVLHIPYHAAPSTNGITRQVVGKTIAILE